jgi:hypothetical protein
MSDSLSPPSPSPLRQRNFLFYLMARVLGTLAVQMQSVAIGWQVYDLTGSLVDLGLIGLAQFAPFLLLILLAGHVADRYDRRRIILICMLAQLLCGALLFMLTFSGIRAVWPIFAVLVLYGGARAFMMPATQAILINLVPQASFGRAVALSSSTFHVAVIAGPVLGGLLYLAGPKVVYAIVACLPAAAAGGGPDVHDPHARPAVWRARTGVMAQPAGGTALCLGAPRGAGGDFAGLVCRAVRRCHRAAAGAGARCAACRADRAWPAAHGARCGRRTDFGVSDLLSDYPPGGALDVRWRRAVRRRHPGAGTVRHPAAVAGGAGADGRGRYGERVRHLLVQLETPDSIRGRVSAVSSVFIGASNELGEFESGITAGWFGLVPAVLLGGALTLGVTALWMWRFPMLRTMDRFPRAVTLPADKR